MRSRGCPAKPNGTSGREAAQGQPLVKRRPLKAASFQATKRNEEFRQSGMNILRGQFLLCIVLHGKRQRGLRRSDEACPLGPTSKAAIDVCAFLPCGSFVWGGAKSVKQGLSPVRMRTYHMRLPDNAAKALSEAAGFEAAKRGSALEAAFSSLHADRLICLKGALGAFPFCTCSAQGRRKRRSRPWRRRRNVLSRIPPRAAFHH